MRVRFTLTTPVLYSSLRRVRDHIAWLRTKRSSKRLRVLLILAVAMLGVLVLAQPALAVGTITQSAITQASSATTAAGNSSNPGLNLVTWLSGWVGGLFALTIGGAGIAVAARRHVGEGLALLLVAVMVGGFVIDPSDMNALTTAIWHKIATGA
jgi:hypothetical protein